MIVSFMEEDYIVCADDHVGHGKTAIENNTWDDWGYSGVHTMMDDEYSLLKITKEKYPDFPYFLFGHSMGSFIARNFISKCGNELSGQGVYETSILLIDTGHNVQTKLFSGYRHEIHNYKEIKNKVVQGIIEFFNSCL